MAKTSISAICWLVLVSAIPCLAESASPSTRLKSMQNRLDRRQAIVNEWVVDSRQQIFFSVTVGVLGLAVGLLQASRKPWARGLTIGLGFCVSAITLFTNKVYVADYRTLQKSVAEATPIIEDLQAIMFTFDPTQSPENQRDVEAEFLTKCQRIDRIWQRLQGVETPSSVPANKSAAWFPGGIVYAQSATRIPPPWIAGIFETDSTSTFFVGASENKSLSAAKTASKDAAVHKAAHWMRGDAPADQKSELPSQLVDLVAHAVDVADTWYSYDRASGVYRYYTLLRLSNEFRSLDLRDTVSEPAKAELPLSVRLLNDSAVRVSNTGLLLLLKHMGAIPMSTDLYVLSGKPSGGETIDPYSSRDREATDRYVARFKSLLRACDGSHANDGGYTVWCFHVEQRLIRRSRGKAQHLGVVTSNGRNLDLSAVDFDDEYHTIEVEVNVAK
jgi:hypothetical protein